MGFFNSLPVPELWEWNFLFPFPNPQKSFPLTPGNYLATDFDDFRDLLTLNFLREKIQIGRTGRRVLYPLLLSLLH